MSRPALGFFSITRSFFLCPFLDFGNIAVVPGCVPCERGLVFLKGRSDAVLGTRMRHLVGAMKGRSWSEEVCGQRPASGGNLR